MREGGRLVNGSLHLVSWSIKVVPTNSHTSGLFLSELLILTTLSCFLPEVVKLGKVLSDYRCLAFPWEDQEIPCHVFLKLIIKPPLRTISVGWPACLSLVEASLRQKGGSLKVGPYLYCLLLLIMHILFLLKALSHSLCMSIHSQFFQHT